MFQSHSDHFSGRGVNILVFKIQVSHQTLIESETQRGRTVFSAGVFHRCPQASCDIQLSDCTFVSFVYETEECFNIDSIKQ